MQLPKNLCFVDIETTGISPSHDRIIEIAILRVEDGKLVQTYNSLVNPQTHVSPYIEAITGITQSEVQNAPSFSEVAGTVKELLSDAVFVAHNVRFDYEFIRHELSRLDLSFSSQKLCTVKLSRKIYPDQPRHDLDSVIQRHNIKCEKRHRALSDAEAIWKFYQIVQNNIPQDLLDSAVSNVMKKPAGPIKIHESKLQNLPEGPGVYIFQGGEASKGIPIYIGKSIHIKQRVFSHFAQNDIATDMRICQEVEDIEAIETAGELGALIREAQLVKKLQPLYNRKLRRVKELIAIIKQPQLGGYETATIATIKSLESADTQNVLGIYKSQRQAQNYLRELTREYQLCPRLLNLEKCAGACMHSQFGWCKGACKNLESTFSYNVRFLEAFANSRIASWPFAGPVRIEEYNEISQKSEQFIVDNWCYLQSSSEWDYWEKMEQTPMFDLDIYKILRRFLRNKKNQKNISPMPLQYRFQTI